MKEANESNEAGRVDRRRIRVLIVDDSAVVRTVLARGLAALPDMEVVATARDPYEARDLLVKLRPDVLTLDVEMPRMDGITFLKRFMAVLPTPTVVLSSLTSQGSRLALQALEAGAIEVLTKPSVGVGAGVEALLADVARSVRVAAVSRVRRRDVPPTAPAAAPEGAALDRSTDLVIALGASTGGVAALGRILPAFPPWSPGVVIVQHMPSGFTADFAKRLDGLCQMRVAEARDGDRVLRGHILIAPGGSRHLKILRLGGQYRVHLEPGDPATGHVPSVDVFFDSLADHVGKNAAACLLTGMGADGAAGLLRLRQAGGRTFAQDRETAAVWGMPAAAAELGAAERLLPLQDVAAVLVGWSRPGSD
jgi:two-component system chemotaxis response regulator CheB